MPYTINYPNGQQLSSSAQSPEGMETIFQALTIGMLGIDAIPAANPAAAYLAVRCAFQQRGQPGPEIDKDTCIISALSDTDPFGRSRDAMYGPNSDVTLDTQYLSHTRVWRMHWDLYGPNSQVNAEALVTGFSQTDWVFNWLVNGAGGAAFQPIYVVAEFPAPVRVPENFQRQWWERSSLDLKFNELVIETLAVQTGISVEITVTADTGETETFTVTASE